MHPSQSSPSYNKLQNHIQAFAPEDDLMSFCGPWIKSQVAYDQCAERTADQANRLKSDLWPKQQQPILTDMHFSSSGVGDHMLQAISP